GTWHHIKLSTLKQILRPSDYAKIPTLPRRKRSPGPAKKKAPSPAKRKPAAKKQASSPAKKKGPKTYTYSQLTARGRLLYASRTAYYVLVRHANRNRFYRRLGKAAGSHYKHVSRAHLMKMVGGPAIVRAADKEYRRLYAPRRGGSDDE